MDYEKEERKDELRKRLAVLQDEMLSKPSSCLYIPLGNVYHRVHKIHVEESFPFSTKERVPYLVCFEVVDYAEDHGAPDTVSTSDVDDSNSKSFVERFRGEFNVTLGKRRITLRVGDGDENIDERQADLREIAIDGMQGEAPAPLLGATDVAPEDMTTLAGGEASCANIEEVGGGTYQEGNVEGLHANIGSGLYASMWSTRSAPFKSFQGGRPRSVSNDGSSVQSVGRKKGFQLGPVFVYSQLENRDTVSPQRSISHNGSFDSSVWNVPKSDDHNDNNRITVPFSKFQLREIFKEVSFIFFLIPLRASASEGEGGDLFHLCDPTCAPLSVLAEAKGY
jgi:hypothetical protein